MPYQNSTNTYRIPYMSQGETSSGVYNRRAANIVDSQLTGVSRLIGTTGILQEGTYNSAFTTNASTISLLGTAENYALEAYIDYRYIAQNNTLVWSNLPNSSTIYLYAIAAEVNLFQSDEFSTLANKTVQSYWNTNGLTPPNGLLLGIQYRV